MAITAVVLGSSVPGNLRRTRIVVTLDSSYPTGGYQLTPAMFGFQFLSHCVPICFTGVPVNCGEFALDETASKLIMLTSAGAQVTNATSLVGTFVNVEGYGN